MYVCVSACLCVFQGVGSLQGRGMLPPCAALHFWVGQSAFLSGRKECLVTRSRDTAWGGSAELVVLVNMSGMLTAHQAPGMAALA